MCKHIQFYHVNLLQAFQIFQFLFFQLKMVNHCERLVIFQDIEHRLPGNIFHDFFH